MESKPPPIGNPPPRSGAKIYFLLLALLPIPMGLLAGPLRLLDITTARGSDPTPLIFFHVFSMICCVTGGIGMCGGFKKDKGKARVGGALIGLILWVFETGIIFFIGCAIGLSKI